MIFSIFFLEIFRNSQKIIMKSIENAQIAIFVIKQNDEFCAL